MLKRLCVSCVCVLVASTAGAATLVTWQVDGTVEARSEKLVPPFPGVPIAPPIGAPFSATLIFDRASAVPTMFGGPQPGCTNLSVSGSITIGGYTAPLGAQSKGYTQSNLPGGGPCQDTTQTQFELRVPAAPADNPFKLPSGILFISYHDLLVNDAFPEFPTPSGPPLATYLAFGGGQFDFVFQGDVQLTAIDQTSPVPEPATLTLFGLGLAAAYRKRRMRTPERQR